MQNYARVEQNHVAEIITIAEGNTLVGCYHSEFIVACHLVGSGEKIALGWVYADGVYSPPPAPPRITVMPANAFLARFRDDERLAMTATFSTHPAVFMFLLTCMSSATVDTASEATVTAVNAVRDAGILTAARADEVLL